MAKPSQTALIALTCACAALCLALHKLVFSNFSTLPGGVDSLFNLFMLEHSWGWLSGQALHARFWDPPFYYPLTNVAAYSDLMLSFGPLYWPFRLLGLTPQYAYLSWIYLTGLFNYLIAFYFLRRNFSASLLAAIFGAYIMVFSQSHLRHFDQTQLYPFFYVLGALIGLFSYFQAFAISQAMGRTWLRRKWLVLSALCLAGQFYGAFYLGYFLCFALLLCLLACLVMPSQRKVFLDCLRADAWFLAGLALFAAALLAPLAWHYLLDLKVLGPRGWDEVRLQTPRVYSWVFNYFGYLTSWMAKVSPWSGLPGGTVLWEHSFGLGLVSSCALLGGLWLKRRAAAWRIISLALLAMILCTSIFLEKYSLWYVLREVMPGAKAIRAVTRIGCLLSIPAGLALAALVDYPKALKWRLAALALAVLCLAEQVDPVFTCGLKDRQNEIALIASQVDAKAQAFVMTLRPRPQGPRDANWETHQIDAMFAASSSGVPTLNGYSGHFTKLWSQGVQDITMPAPQSRARFQAELEKWCVEQGLDRSKVQWIEID